MLIECNRSDCAVLGFHLSPRSFEQTGWQNTAGADDNAIVRDGNRVFSEIHGDIVGDGECFLNSIYVLSLCMGLIEAI